MTETNPFKPGDRIRLRYDDVANQDVIYDLGNKIYTVDRVNPAYVYLEDDSGGWSWWRFDLVDTEDVIAHPSHYRQGMPDGVEVIDIIRAQNGSWEHSNALKYILRAQFKGNYKQDIAKAIQYLTWALERAE